MYSQLHHDLRTQEKLSKYEIENSHSQKHLKNQRRQGTSSPTLNAFHITPSRRIIFKIHFLSVNKMKEGAVADVAMKNISQIFSTLQTKSLLKFIVSIFLLTRAEILGPELSIPLLVSVGRA